MVRWVRLPQQYIYIYIYMGKIEKQINPAFGLVQLRLLLWHINLCRLFDAKSIFIHINSSIINNIVHSLSAKNSSISSYSI